MTKTGSSESSAQRSFSIEHTSLGTGLSYDALIRVFERELRYLDRELYSVSPNEGCVDRDRKRDHENSDPHGLMIIARVDLGGVASLSGHKTRCSLYLVGNPLIANQIISIDLRGSFYVPVRVALYDDGTPRAP